MTLDEYFEGQPAGRRLFDALRRKIERLGEAEVRVSKSQVAFRRGKKTFARAWRPRQYLSQGAPLVLTLGFDRRDPSPRWKEIVEPRAGQFTHHLELHKARDLDAEVMAWLRRAWDAAE
jgi:hypothetical protein